MTSNGAVLGGKEQAIANARRLLLGRDFSSAADQASEIVDGDDHCAEAWRVLGMALRGASKTAEAQKAEEAALRESALQPEMFHATLAIADNRLDEAEQLLRNHLRAQPDDAAALRQLAEVAARLGRYDAAEKLLKNALRIAPDFAAAKLLLDRVGHQKAGTHQQSSLKFPRGLRVLHLDAAHQYAEALQLYERVVELYPDAPLNWVSYGHILRTVGRQQDAVAAYRRAISLKPDTGEAWWALADLKTQELGSADIDQLAGILAAGDVEAAELSRLNFALARALEHAGLFEESFRYYSEGNRVAAAVQSHDRTAIKRHVGAAIRLFDTKYLQARANSGFNAADPIFVLGMPRAGSTLVEQILSSHAEVEGTMELPDIIGIASWLANGKQAAFEDSDYLANLAALPPAELLKLGKGYIWGTGLRRQTDKPFFIDKMPNNWLHLGLILTILPNARIIDARRHPMACGLSNFRQHFAKGQGFSYDLADIGSFYSDYVRLMAHFDRVMPGRVIRVIHEELTADPDGQIRHLLDRLGLPFDEACLKFHENKRAVRTSSSEQVRRPITTEGVDQWRAFEPWLGPLKQALGPIVDCYPSAPQNL